MVAAARRGIVTGHAMAAAIPAVMFDGILDSQMAFGDDLESLFSRLNERLVEKMQRRSHICFSMAQIDVASLKARFGNAGNPYPMHYRASDSALEEIRIDAYPLGVRAQTSYDITELTLRHGDRLIFYSDGIPEAMNGNGDIFGYDRTSDTLRQACDEGVSAKTLVDRVLSDVANFCGNRPQDDDQTIVVVAVED